METTPAPRPVRSAAAVIGAVALMTACGGGESGESSSAPSPAASSSTAPAASSSTSTSSGTASTSSGTASETPSESESESKPESAEEVVITISDFDFSLPASVPAGAEVTVTNEDEVGHTVTADEGDTFDVVVGPGETTTFTAPETAGEYAFHCTPHPAMTATLVVG